VTRPLVIWGASGHARVLAEFVEGLGYEIVALFDNDPTRDSPVAGVPLLRGREGLDRWRAGHGGDAAGLVAVGGVRGADRLELQALLAASGCEPVAVVHPTAWVAADARIGPGSQVLAKAGVGAGSSLGAGCIVNTSASVDHECSLGDGVHVAPGATLAGCIVVGDRAFVGAGAVVLPRLRIGADAVVGAGAVVTRDVPVGATVVGNPARPRD
jgi:sugar O-acyltransferase (sialic acid O-acetyltransferase NeuD family)